MRMMRSSVRVPPSLTSRRVELVPQSMLATSVVSLSDIEVVLHPPPDRIVSAGQVPGVVRVQALHAAARAADAAGRAGPGVVRRKRSVALGRVATMRLLQRAGVDVRFGLPHAARRLEA